MASDEKRSAQLTFDFGDIPEDAVSLPDEEMGEGNSSSILSEDFLFAPPEDEDLAEGEEEDSSFSGSAPVNAAESEKEEEDWEVVEEEIVEKEEERIPPPGDSPAAEEKNEETEEETPAPAPVPAPAPALKTPKAPKMDSRLFKRAALSFLASLNPSGLAMDVPTRYRKYVVDGAAFWAEPDKKGNMQVVRTAVVETRLEKALCNACEDPGRLLSELSAAKEERTLLEASIRENEPHLKDADSLFSEHALWHYEKSKDPAYKELLKKIKHLEYTLFHGSSFDKLRKAKVATEFYLLLPEGEELPETVAEAWGIVILGKDLKLHLKKEAVKQESPETNCRHLALNIGRSTLHNVLFAQGIVKDPLTGELSLGKLPRKRRNQI